MNSTETKQCKKCKEQINKKAKKCPHCGAKQGLPIWIIVILVIIVIGILANIGDNSDETTSNAPNDTTNVTTNENSSNQTQQTQETIEYIKVSKDDLDDALNNNAAAAKDTYNKKYVEVTGRLGTIDSDLKYISLISTTNKYDIIGIHCTIKNSTQKDIIKTLSKDQEITIRGKITDVGEVLGYYLDITEIITN